MDSASPSPVMTQTDRSGRDAASPVAMAGEFAHGPISLADPGLAAGLTAFREGAGRHGQAAAG